jgi:aspartate 1-decarboxylase
MLITLLKCKIHRATITDADLNYEGSITIDTQLCDQAGLREFEQVDVYNCNNGARFTTYVIYGRKGEICVNGAAARLVHRGDKIIIASYAQFTSDEASAFKPRLVFVDDSNAMKELKARG